MINEHKTGVGAVVEAFFIKKHEILMAPSWAKTLIGETVSGDTINVEFDRDTGEIWRVELGFGVENIEVSYDDEYIFENDDDSWGSWVDFERGAPDMARGLRGLNFSETLIMKLLNLTAHELADALSLPEHKIVAKRRLMTM